MPPEALAPASLCHEQSGYGLTPAWCAALKRLTPALIALLLLFREDWLAMARQWWNISTYNHILLIPVIVGWLVWQRRQDLSRLAPTPWWPGLVLAGGAALFWVLGAFADLSTARQLGVVAMLIGTVLALLGPKVGAGLAFPLAYLLFLVPAGDEIVPALQMITASITIGLVRMSSIPAVIDGVFIDTPAGLFEVAEACSGVKFLVAMVAFGVLVANLCFVSWRRRALFLSTCVIAPVLANGVRAWATVYAAQIWGAEAAAGFDHIVYGWFFFATVMGLILAGAWRFFDRSADAPMIDAAAIEDSPVLDRLAGLRAKPLVALALLAGFMLASQAWAHAGNAQSAVVPDKVRLPEVPGWKRVAFTPRVWWHPRANGSSHRLLGRYVDDEGHVVDVFVALYARQSEGREAGGFGEGALMPDSEWSWQSPGPEAGGAKSDRLLAHGRVERIALTWYVAGDLVTGSNARIKLATMQDRLLLRPRPTMLLIFSTEQSPDHDAAASLTAFRTAAGPVGDWMARIAATAGKR